MKALYFAWVRERIGVAEEELSPPPGVSTISDLMIWLRDRGEGYDLAFENMKAIRTALDRTHARHDAPIGNAREIAFFPPMTGG
ncbi:molybdopterin converting factor subunit 1 [Methylocella tundrae]|jgi:molybdopterin synthase sulfur carrier subunit|uniref:Molybdopterin synthase sulfur carrier subunit n=1 Tax=Methylocella tundrae TaxID=227605 RepID=A0A4U8Z1C8_METTU|nr:molybdopterin converting factor subunit 1 [Methylocella tundrae]WPP03120.1 molybdopterin converting factor subunit 1 [Methylocella tundrae]VFU09091.1 Molybdopterin synthase sulfur carrier subunit [Methylocella tundrae]